MAATAPPATSAQPMWRRIAAAIERSIADGSLPVGGRVPSEHELAARFQASRPTVVRAVRHLADHGLVRRQQGVGTFVSTATSIPPSTVLRLDGTERCRLRITGVPDGAVHMLAVRDSVEVAWITVHAGPVHWKAPEELTHWSVLTGASGWNGAARTSRVDLVRAGGAAFRLRLTSEIVDEFSDRRCRVEMLLDPDVFSIDVIEPLGNRH